jgi:hypothetical protein
MVDFESIGLPPSKRRWAMRLFEDHASDVGSPGRTRFLASSIILRR